MESAKDITICRRQGLRPALSNEAQLQCMDVITLGAFTAAVDVSLKTSQSALPTIQHIPWGEVN